MVEFSKGGIIHGEAKVFVKMVDYPSWNDEYVKASSALGNGMFIMYANECLIGHDKKCKRVDEAHRRFPPDEAPQGLWRFWYCPLHDKEDRRA